MRDGFPDRRCHARMLLFKISSETNKDSDYKTLARQDPVHEIIRANLSINSKQLYIKFLFFKRKKK
jgi:hypothetical protein